MNQPVLMVTGDFVQTGGMDRANYALASFLADEGMDVHLAAHRVEDALSKRPNVRVHLARKPWNSSLLGSPALACVAKGWAKRITHTGGRVIVNGGNCFWGDVNWVHYVHASYEPHARNWRRPLGLLKRGHFLLAEAACLRAARILIANSQRTREELIRRLAIPGDRIETVYYGSDPNEFFPASHSDKRDLRCELAWPVDRPIFLFVGALGDRRKGFDTVFNAWLELRKRLDWSGQLKVVGSGAELASWQTRVTAAGLEDSVTFLQRRNDIGRLMRAADGLVSPTRYEAYGLAVHEAICCGIPAWVSRDAGVAERYPTELGALLLSNPASVGELVEKLSNWQDVCQGALLRFSDHLRLRTWDDMSADILSLLAQRCETTSQRPSKPHG